MKRASALWYVVLCVAMAFGQQKGQVQPPPKPENKGPSLEGTRKFIQEKLDELNYVSWITTLSEYLGAWPKSPA